MIKCPKCSAVLTGDQKRCRFCGGVLRKNAETLSPSDSEISKMETIRQTSYSMDGEKWHKMKLLFKAALELEPPQRPDFLKNACGDDAELCREVENLLTSFDDAKDFMNKPAAAEVASLFEDKKTLAANQTTGEIASGNFIAGTILAERYRIIGLLGKGGMGEVFKAEDLKLNQIVALKFLPDKLEKDKAALARFIGEVRTARQVSHPNVCRVFDIGDLGGRHFLSMEFIDGDDLSSLLRRIGRLPSDKAVEISRQICLGLHAIHDAGILHRDLKPANVIIDSRGRARITDFGIAGLEEDVSKEDVRVGTPAYMSPEQITGRNVTVKSDIYSLGLLIYEIFTGKQAFQADSINDLIKKQTSETPTNPSTFVENINPLIEKIINRCLEKNPSERPESALKVALALPGANPLEAAIAAGETPSPEMVAAAPKKGALKPAVAVACLSAVILLFSFIVFFAGKVKDHEIVPLEKSPEVLAERAASIIKKLGYHTAPADVNYGFGKNVGDYYRYAAAENAPNRWERLRSGQPAIIYFWHRSSPRYLEPLQYESVSPDDPPNDVAGMTKIILDVRGRLLEFQAVPPQVKDKQAQSGEVDWTMLFAEAGLDIRGFRPTESNWTSPVFADTNLAWEGSHVDHAEIPVRIEAAAYQAKPVYFQIVAPWDKPVRQEETDVTTAVKIAGVLLISLFLSLIIAGIFLARRNLQRGRSDAKGAFKITIFTFVMSLAAGLLSADHIPNLQREVPLLTKMAGTSLFNGALIGLIYLALEPYVRRCWASLLISWNRLLAGDFRDPLVGRDILIGGIFGLGHTTAIYLMNLLPTGIGETVEPSAGMDVSFLQGFKHLLATFLAVTGDAVLFALFQLLFLVLLATIFRKQWLAMFIFFGIYFLINGLFFASDGHWLGWLAPAMIAILNVVCIARFGLLANISFFVFFFLTFHNPVTTNVSSWYFGNTIFAGAVIFSLAIYGFYISLAGQSIFQGKWLAENEIK